jgi:hypothetical protein
MLTLTTEHGTFTGESMREVQRAAAEAARDARKQALQTAADQKQAQLYAYEHGYRLLLRLVEGQGMPPGWRVISTNDRYASCQLVTGETGNPMLRIQGEQGAGVWEISSSDRVAQYIENGAGFPLAIFLEVQGTISCHAVGCCGAQVAFARVPGITPELFQPRGEAGA